MVEYHSTLPIYLKRKKKTSSFRPLPPLSKEKLGGEARGGFGWKGRAQPPSLVYLPSDYPISVPVHRRNPRLARVQRGLLGLHGTIPSRVGVVVLPFYCLVLSRPRYDKASFSLGLQINLDLFHYFGGWWASHRLRTKLSFIACYIFQIALLLLLFLRAMGEGVFFPPSARYLYRSSGDLPCIPPMPLPPLSHTTTPSCDTIL